MSQHLPVYHIYSPYDNYHYKTVEYKDDMRLIRKMNGNKNNRTDLDEVYEEGYAI